MTIIPGSSATTNGKIAEREIPSHAPRMTKLSFPESAVRGLLGSIHDVSAPLPGPARVSIRLVVLRFVAQAFAPSPPTFSIDEAIGGKIDATKLALATLIAVFRHYDEQRDERYAPLAAQLVWAQIHAQRTCAVN
jgi:hypothetical protein